MGDTTKQPQSSDPPFSQDSREEALSEVFRVMDGAARSRMRASFFGLAITITLVLFWELFSFTNPWNTALTAILALWVWGLALGAKRPIGRMEAPNPTREAAFFRRYQALNSPAGRWAALILLVTLVVLQITVGSEAAVRTMFVAVGFAEIVRRLRPSSPIAAGAPRAAAQAQLVHAPLHSAGYYRRFALFAKWMLFVTVMVGVAAEFVIRLSPLLRRLGGASLHP